MCVCVCLCVCKGGKIILTVAQVFFFGKEICLEGKKNPPYKLTGDRNQGPEGEGRKTSSPPLLSFLSSFSPSSLRPPFIPPPFLKNVS